MIYIGRKVYFVVETGEVILITSQKRGLWAEQTSYEKDLVTFPALSERNPETFDVIELEYDQYAQDFLECDGYRVNPQTLELEFSYPDPNEPEAQQPYIKPLSESVNEQMDYLVDVDFRLSLIELGL